MLGVETAADRRETCQVDGSGNSRLRRMCARCAKARHTFLSISIPSFLSFFFFCVLFFHGPSGPSTLAVSWHFGPASSIPFRSLLISPWLSQFKLRPSCLSFFLAHYYTHVSHKSPTLLPFRHCVLDRGKIRVLLCVVTQTTTIPAELFLFFSSLSLSQFQWRHSRQFRQNAINDNGKWGERERERSQILSFRQTWVGPYGHVNASIHSPLCVL